MGGVCAGVCVCVYVCGWVVVAVGVAMGMGVYFRFFLYSSPADVADFRLAGLDTEILHWVLSLSLTECTSCPYSLFPISSSSSPQSGEDHLVVGAGGSAKKSGQKEICWSTCMLCYSTPLFIPSSLSPLPGAAAPGQVFVANLANFFGTFRHTPPSTPSIAELLGETVECKGLINTTCSPILYVCSRLSH